MFLEFSQGQAERHLDRLHQCAAKDVQVFLDQDTPTNFNEFRIKIVELTNKAYDCFEYFVQYLENRLADDQTSSNKRKRRSQ